MTARRRRGRTAADLTPQEVNQIVSLRRQGANHTRLSKQFKIPIYEVLKIVR